MSAKFGVDTADELLNDLENKLQGIQERYRAGLTAAKNAEKSDNASVAAQGTKTRLDLENAMNIEIEKARDDHYLKLQQKKEENWQAQQLALASKDEAEILEVIFHYQKLIDAAQGNDEQITALIKAQGNKIAEIRKGQNKKELDDEEKKRKTIEQGEKDLAKIKMDIQNAQFENLKKGFQLIDGLLSDNAKKSKAYFIISRGIAMAEVIML